MSPDDFTIQPIGYIHSHLTRREDAPRQGDEGAPAAWLEFKSEFTPGLKGINAGDELFLLTWLHLSNRETLQVHPRGDRNRPLNGVFATRSPSRPNPIGLHRITVLEIAPQKLRVAPLEAINGTPIIDLKPILKGTNPADR